MLWAAVRGHRGCKPLRAGKNLYKTWLVTMPRRLRHWHKARSKHFVVAMEDLGEASKDLRVGNSSGMVEYKLDELTEARDRRNEAM